jgi:hypothetical protein
MNAHHVLHVKPDWGAVTLRLECTDACPKTCWQDRRWPNSETCHCTEAGNDCDSCRGGDHGGCGFYGGYSSVGYECRVDVIEGHCWLQDWLDECGVDMLGKGEWPEDGPWPVTVVGGDDAPVLVPAKDGQ